MGHYVHYQFAGYLGIGSHEPRTTIQESMLVALAAWMMECPNI